MAWKDEGNPSLGFEYLYLSEEDYTALPKVTTITTTTALTTTITFDSRYI